MVCAMARMLDFDSPLYESPGDEVPRRRRPRLRVDLPVWLGNALGVALMTAALITVIGLAPPATHEGALLTLWVRFWRRVLGWGAWMIPILLSLMGLTVLQISAGVRMQWRWTRWLAWEVAYFATLALLSLAHQADFHRALNGYDGGVVGWALASALLRVLPDWAAIMLSLGLVIFGVSTGVGLLGWVLDLLRASLAEPDFLTLPAQAEEKPRPQTKTGLALSSESRKPSKARTSKRKPPPPQSETTPPPARTPRDTQLPPLDLLDPEEKGRADTAYIQDISRRIEETLREFGVPARVVGVQVGPSVLQFAVEPGHIERTLPDGTVKRQKVRVSKIVGLRRDLALALAVKRLRIQAPVPGRPYLGIEIPNPQATLVRLRPLLMSPEFQKVGSPLTIAVGRGVAGDIVVADLRAMPHLLVAGTTGSGKSIFLKALILTFIMNLSPQDLRLILIDPKRVELSRFQGLPHLLGRVEVEPKRVQGVLQWVVAEMQRRYRLFEKARVRDIVAYRSHQARQGEEERLPYLVVVIDELADLMVQAPEQTEFALVRLAQLARATGIHLVISTQRPSVDVITGLIKANFPARIAFLVASSVDSRVILDQPGAETLLGRGDMLFLPPDAPAPIRVQGPFVSEQEIRRVVDYWKQSWSGEQAHEAPWEGLLAGEQHVQRWDPLLEEAARIVIETQRAHTSLLQRRLRIGYPRAARIMEQLERLGIVGPAEEGSRERVVLVEPGTPFHLGESNASTDDQGEKE